MRELLEARTFQQVRMLGSGRELGGVDLRRGRFDSCVLAQHDDPGLGLAVRNVTLTGCSAANCTVHGVRFEDVTVHGLALSRLLQLEGCVFRHVTFRGRIGPLMTVPVHHAVPEPLQAAFTAAIAEHYRDVDWALDISEAEFSDADFYLVPGHLVRRDPETQLLLHREAVGDARARGVKLPVHADIAFSRFESTPFDSIVAVAPRRSKHFADYMADFRFLRKAGLAE